jgi:tetratricopeptide (TPR) repeat protein
MTGVRSFHSVAYGMLATAYAEHRKDTGRALTILDEGLERCYDHPTLLFVKGYTLSLERRFDDARAWYQRAIETPADARRHFVVDDEIRHWKAPLNIGVTFLKEEREAEALPWFERAFAAKPESERIRTILSKCYERLGRTYDAERLLRDAAARGASDASVELVNFLMRRRRFSEALALVEQTVSVPPRALAALQLSAAIVLRDEHLGDPEPYARRALALAPGYGQALTLLDDWYASTGREADRLRLRAEELDAPLVEIGDFARRSHRLLEEGRLVEALETVEAGLRIAASDPLLAFNGALAAARLGRDGEAIAFLDGIAPSAPSASAALVLRVEIATRRADLDAAVTTFDRVGTLAQPDVAVIRAGALQLAQTLIAAGRVDDAARVAQRALA